MLPGVCFPRLMLATCDRRAAGVEAMGMRAAWAGFWFHEVGNPAALHTQTLSAQAGASARCCRKATGVGVLTHVGRACRLAMLTPTASSTP
eukprot:182110-Chlamydomonas_euryale.AAC.1